MQTSIPFEGFHRENRFETEGRTITQTDIIEFVCLIGMLEPLFIDKEYIRKESLFGQRVAPGSLTFSMTEGLTVQTGILHTTGMAFVSLDKMKLFGPVMLDDTIRVEIEVLDKRKLTSHKGGIVRYQHRIRNQKSETIMEYVVFRLIRLAEENSK